MIRNWPAMVSASANRRLQPDIQRFFTLSHGGVLSSLDGQLPMWGQSSGIVMPRQPRLQQQRAGWVEET